MKKNTLILLMIFGFGCSQAKDGIKEKAAIESTVAANSAVEAENNNLTKKVQEIETDLDRRQRFIDALSGTFVGTTTYMDNQELNVRFVITPTITRYQANRTRTLEEVESDINNLYVNVHASQWDTKRSFASACIFENMRPDLLKGRLELVSSNCNYSYSLSISNADTSYSQVALIESQQSASLATDAREGRIQFFGGLIGERRSSSRSGILGLSVKRVMGADDAVEPTWSSISDEDTAIRLFEMEADLEMRHRFYDAIAGVYEGSMQYPANREVGIRFVFTPNIPRVQFNRQRTISEIESDLKALTLNVQVVQWDKYYSFSTGCTFESVNPDFTSGKIQLVSSNCQNMYSLEFSDLATDVARSPGDVSLSIKSGLIHQVDSLKGTRSSAKRAEIFSLTVSRINGQAPSSIPEVTSLDEADAIRIFEMEADLARRFRFFQAVSGIYEGEYPKEVGMYATRITITPSISPYTAKRLRTPDEIATDIENLSLNIHIIQWNPKTPMDAGGCRIEGIRPNLVTGEIAISKESCPFIYTLSLTEGALSNTDKQAKSTEITSNILDGKTESVLGIVGRKQTSVNALFYDFSAKRIK